MERLLLIIVLVLNIGTVLGQQSFVKTFGDSKTELPTSIKQIGDSYFLTQITATQQSLYDKVAKITKLNKFGNITSSLSFPVKNRVYTDFDYILPLDNGEFIIIGNRSYENSPYVKMWVVKMDTLLNVHWENEYYTNWSIVNSVSAAINYQGNIIIGCGAGSGTSPNYLFSAYLLEISLLGDSLRSNSLTPGSGSTFTNLESILPFNGYYKAFVQGYYAYTNTVTQILLLDTDLNLIEVRPIPGSIDAYLNAAKTNEDEYYLTGKVYETGTHYDVAIAKFDTFENTLAYNEAGSPGNSVDYTAWKQCMAIADSNSIYTGGTGNDNGNFYACHENYMKAMMLSNYDSELNCRWTYFYGSDTACYTMSTMDATSDGGCVMAGIYYDPSRPEKMLDVIVIKVDRTGIITGTKGVQDITSRNAIVFPNPGKDRIHIKSGPQIEGSLFMLHTMSGQVVSTISLNSTDEQLNAESLAPGVYPWIIIKNGKLIEQGKWIKQQ